MCLFLRFPKGDAETLYCMSQEELLRTAKEILEKVGVYALFFCADNAQQVFNNAQQVFNNAQQVFNNAQQVFIFYCNWLVPVQLMRNISTKNTITFSY